MSSGPRYQALQNEEDEVTVTNHGVVEEVSTCQPTSVVHETPPIVDDSPPPYDPNEAGPADVTYDNTPPPLYTEVVKLPTYNESENIDSPEEEDDAAETNPSNHSMLFFWLYNGLNNNNNNQEINEEEAGTHVGFIFAFLISFVFNWLGFLISYCFSKSLSSHYGAISGFGLSLVKWGFVMKHYAHFSKDYVGDNPWLFYLFVLFGWMCFLRGIIAYAQLTRYTRRARNDAPRGLFM